MQRAAYRLVKTATHRLGTCYPETGHSIRSSRVIYDQKHSALTEYDLTRVDAPMGIAPRVKK